MPPEKARALGNPSRPRSPHSLLVSDRCGQAPFVTSQLRLCSLRFEPAALPTLPRQCWTAAPGAGLEGSELSSPCHPGPRAVGRQQCLTAVFRSSVKRGSASIRVFLFCFGLSSF